MDLWVRLDRPRGGPHTCPPLLDQAPPGDRDAVEGARGPDSLLRATPLGRRERLPAADRLPPTGDRERRLKPLDARAADDRVPAVVEAHPDLALAVVVGRPDDERRVATADAAALRPLRLDPAPDAHERVLLPLAADRRLLGVAGEDARL